MIELLEPLRDQIPERVFTEVYEPPPNQGHGWHRENLLRAAALLREAGWGVRGNRLVHEETGEDCRDENDLLPQHERWRMKGFWSPSCRCPSTWRSLRLIGRRRSWMPIPR